MTEVAYLVVSLLLIVALANSSRRSSPPSLRTGGPSTGPIVDESRGEGLLEANEYDRLAGAHGFTERTVIDVLLARGSPRHGGPCSATCTSRTSWKPTRSGESVRRRQVDPVLRDGASR